ncbi:MAG: hypothetical protein RIS76_2105, partial [Verrucomicrobiota bacterium]
MSTASRMRGLLPLLLATALRAAEDFTPEVPTFYGQVAPLLWQHCASCHRPGQAGPFSLLTLDDARKHARDMVDATSRRYMPPWLPEA